MNATNASSWILHHKSRQQKVAICMYIGHAEVRNLSYNSSVQIDADWMSEPNW